ncbi:MAG: hypothetical protein ACD_72C00431G0001, partial [uncultured bacterium]
LGVMVLLFYVAIIISALIGENFGRSLWGRTERMTGLFIMAHYLILFFVWRSVFSKEDWYKLWQWFVGLGAVVPAIAVLQIFNSRLLLNAGAGRMSSTLGNPIFLAGFAGFLFFSSILFYKNTITKFKYFWLIEAVISLIAIFASQTRGDLVGLYFGLLFCLVFLVRDVNWKEKIKINLLLLSFLLVAPVLLFSLRNFSLVKNIPTLNRLVSTSLSTGGGSRLLMWQTAGVGWQQKSIFGWGWENFYDLFNKNYLPEFSRQTEDWQDNAHSVPFNLLATTGAVGLMAYLAVYFYIFYLLFKNYQLKNKQERFFSVIFGAFWLYHFIRNLFVFEELSSYLVFFWMLAGADIYFGINRKSDLNIKTNNHLIESNKFFKLFKNSLVPFIKFLLITVIIFATFLYYFRLLYLPAKADYYAAQAVKKSMVDFKVAMELHRKAVNVLNPYRPDIAFEFGQFIVNWLSAHPDFVFGDYRPLAKEMYDFGVGALESYASDYPNDARVAQLLGSIYGQGSDFWGDPSYLGKATSVYESYLPTSPNRQTLVFGLARAKMLQGKTDEALKIIDQFIARFPTFSESYWMRSLIFAYKNDNLSAFDNVKKALELGYNLNSNELLFSFNLFKNFNSINLLENNINEYLLNSKSPNLRLVDQYIDYLNKTNRQEEVKNLKLKFNR